MSPSSFKDKTLLVRDYELFPALAERLARDFGRVLYYSPPERTAFPSVARSSVGDGLDNVTRINNFYEAADSADIIVFPDILDADLQEHYRRLGKRVWGSGRGDSLELQRWELKLLLESLGLPVIYSERVIGVDALRDRLLEVDDKFVKVDRFRSDMETHHHRSSANTKLWLAGLTDKLGPYAQTLPFIIEDAINDSVEIGIDTFCIDGKYPTMSSIGYEMKGTSYVGRRTKYDALPASIRRICEALSPTLRELSYRNFLSIEIRLGADKKPYVIDPCFDDRTEVLTDKGWKYFAKLDKTEKIATLNKSTGEIEYQFPTDYIDRPYVGKLINITNAKKTIECTVTPNHFILRTDRHKKEMFVERADSLTDRGYIPRTGVWVGENAEFFTLPKYHKEWNFVGQYGHTICKKVKHENEIRIPIEAWFAFLAWYLSEGSIGNEWVVQISQKVFKDAVRQVIKSTGFKFTESGDNFRICSVQLVQHLKEFGLCYEKYVPDYVKNATPKQIRVFLDNYRLGDGTIHKGNFLYLTTSKRMSDDLQELIFKVGSISSIKERRAKGTVMSIGGKSYTRKHNLFVVSENQKEDFWFETAKRKSQYINEIDYDGRVYCVTVPNRTLYVRKNGSPFWSSNCCRMGSPPGATQIGWIDNLSDIIWYGAEGIVIEPEYNAEYACELLFASTLNDSRWLAVEYPPEIKPYVKLRNSVRVDGIDYIVPRFAATNIGAVIASDDSLRVAIKRTKQRADELKVPGLVIDIDSLDHAQEVIDEGKQYGIDF